MPETQKSEDHRRLPVAICIFLTMLVWLVFGQTVRFGFVNFDDDLYVYKNPVVASGFTLRGLEWAFTRIHAFNWHPLTTISHMLDCQLLGVSPGGAHFVNVLLHTIAVLLLFLVLWQMTSRLWPSAFVAALFAIHPLRVESVAWISERKDVLSGVFFMLTLGAYVSYVRRPTVGRYIAISIFYALGLMAKPMLVTLPFVLLLLDYWPLERNQRSEVRGRKSEESGQTSEVGGRRTAAFTKVTARQGGQTRGQWSVVSGLLREKIPLFALAAAASIITLIVQWHSTHLIKDLAFPMRLSNAFLSYLIYVKEMFWPANLAIFYPFTYRGRLAVIVVVLFLIIVSAQVIAANRRLPYLVTGWFWYIVVLVPVIGLVQVGAQGHADRYTYLPHIGLYLALTWMIADLSRSWRYRNQLLGVGAAAVLGMLSWSAHEQTRYWRDSGTLWRHALAVTQKNYLAHNNLAAFLETGDEAVSHLQEALRLQPDYATAHEHLGRILVAKGETDKAIEHFQKTVAFEPYNAGAWGQLGYAFVVKGKAREAAGYYERALGNDPDLLNSLNGLAWILATCPDASLRNGARAMQLSRTAVELSRRQDVASLRSLAAAYAETGHFDKAIAVANEALQLALTQSNSNLVSRLKLELDLYQTHLPLRDHSLKHGDAAP